MNDNNPMSRVWVTDCATDLAAATGRVAPTPRPPLTLSEYEKFITDSKNLLTRLEQLKNTKKMKWLTLYLEWDKKYDSYCEECRKNKDLWEIYTDALYEYILISESLTEKEAIQYGNMLPD